jgi:signal transduction histidine kinase
LAVVSHDLKSPLSAIAMSTRLMLQRAELVDQVRKQAGSIQRSVERMHSLIRDLLDLATIDAGRLSLRLDDEDARALVHEAVAVARPFAMQKSQKIEAPPGPPIPLECDRERILQVLSNLIGNAIKFTPAGGTITVRVAQHDRQVDFAVSDDGPGVPADQLRHIFRRFSQPRGVVRSGTGIGLSIVKGLVEAHGGRVWVESTVGSGSTFSFALPSRARPRARASYELLSPTG